MSELQKLIKAKNDIVGKLDSKNIDRDDLATKSSALAIQNPRIKELTLNEEKVVRKAELFQFYMDLYLSVTEDKTPVQPEFFFINLTRQNIVARAWDKQQNLDNIRKSVETTFESVAGKEKYIKVLLDTFSKVDLFLTEQEELETLKMKVSIEVLSEYAKSVEAKREKRSIRKGKK